MIRRFSISFVIFFLIGFIVFISGAEELSGGYHESVLDNGATVVAKYVPSSPLVTVQIRVLSGLSNEGIYAGTGVSHFLEHLLFKGTSDKSSEEVRAQIKSMGGIVNGATGLDSAEYYITVPNENFEEALNLLVDMVATVVFTDGEFAKEREVVLKEIMLRNDDPTTRRIRLLFSQAYRQHVYKYPIIGYAEKLAKLSKEDIIRYHNAVYTPDRMVIGITGGVTPEKALETAENKLKGYTRGNPWLVEVSAEPRQLAERNVEFREDVSLGYFAIAFHSSDIFSLDLYAGDVLSILLGEGNDSRLYSRLVKDAELLYTVSSFNYTPKYPGLFVITGTGDPAKLEEARQEIFSVIDELKKAKIQDPEVERAKNSVISAYLHSRERIDSINASMTSSQILTGDPAFFEKYVEEVKKVDKEQIKDVLERYLAVENSTTVTLLPRYYKEKPKRVEEEDETEAASEKLVKLNNGLRIVIKKKGNLPLVSMALAVPGGLLAEDKSDNGISNLMSLLMLKGTKKRSEKEIIPVIERMGGSIGAFSGLNSIGLTMSLLAEDLDAGLDILEDVAMNSTFPEDEVEKQKTKISAAIRHQDNNIFENGMVRLRSVLYGDHPYAMRILGEEKTVKAVPRKDIKAFYGKHMVPQNAVLTVVGDVDVDKVSSDLAKRFGKWKGKAKKPEEKNVPFLGGIKEADIFMRKEQALLLLGFRGIEITDERRHVLSVISSLLSGSDGLLFFAVREEQGISYTTGAASVPSVDPGYFLIYVATTEENIGKAKETVLGLLTKISAGDIDEAEIEASKNKLISQHAYSIETNASMSMIMVLDELYGLGFLDYRRYPAKIRAVSKDDITKCALEIFDPDKYAVVVVHSEQ